METTTTSWAAVSAIAGISSGVVIGAAAYLKMSIKGEMAVMERNIMLQIESKFSTKELVTSKLTDIERRIGNMETLMETIRVKKLREDNNREDDDRSRR